MILNLVRNALDAVAQRAITRRSSLETGVASVPAALRERPDPPARARLGPGQRPRHPRARCSPRLFTPFATSKPHGTGLGLAISRRIVEAHGGRIEVRNRAAGGAEANVYLPLDA